METSSEMQDFCSDPSQAQPAGQNAGSNEVGRALFVRPARGFVRFLYSSNPFYILSADLVFVVSVAARKGAIFAGQSGPAIELRNQN